MADSLDSLERVRDFEKRISQAPSDPKQERFVRELLARISFSCPMPVLIEIANHVLQMRKAELKTAGETN